jgi:outer membrane protein assembly factor BamB
MKLPKSFAAVAFFVGIAGILAAPGNATKDWPQWHGHNRDNISRETGLLQQWPNGGPPLAWKIGNIGAGFSSVAVADGKIFTAGDEGDSSYVYALGEADGQRIWRAKLGKPGEPGGYPGTRATPTVDGQRVYMIGQFGDVACYDVADGNQVWKKNLKDDFKGRMMSGWGNSESLLVDGDKLICTPGGGDGTVLALNKNDGSVVWRSKDFKDAAAYASPIAVDFGGVHQIIVFTDKSLAGVAAADGKLLWRHDRPGRTAVIPTPVVKDNYVFVTSGYDVGCDLFRIDAQGGKFKATKVYSSTKMVNHHGGVVLLDGKVYGYSDRVRGDRESGGWTCLDLMTGNVVWREPGKLGKGAISYADGRFYLRSESGRGTMVLIDASPDGWNARGRFDQPDRSRREAWPHLVIANGKMYVRDQATLLCYNIKG